MFSFLDDFLKKRNIIWPAGIYGETWLKCTYLIASIKAIDGGSIFEKTFNNEHGQHAEMVMLHHSEFLKVVKENSNTEITVTLNHSPCSDCANNLKTFYEDYAENIKKSSSSFHSLFIQYIIEK